MADDEGRQAGEDGSTEQGSASVDARGAPVNAPAMSEEARAFVEMLFDAARAGDAARLAEFLDQGLPANLRNGSGDSLLMIASYHDHEDATRLLLQRGADPEMANARGQTPLAGVAFKGSTDLAALLLDHGAAVDGRIAGGRTPLMMAAMFDRRAMVDLLLARGADRALTSDDGATAADAARSMGATGIVERLRQG